MSFDTRRVCDYKYCFRSARVAELVDARDNGFQIKVVRIHEEERNHFGLILVE